MLRSQYLDILAEWRGLLREFLDRCHGRLEVVDVIRVKQHVWQEVEKDVANVLVAVTRVLEPHANGFQKRLVQDVDVSNAREDGLVAIDDALQGIREPLEQSRIIKMKHRNENKKGKY